MEKKCKYCGNKINGIYFTDENKEHVCVDCKTGANSKTSNFYNPNKYYSK